MCHLDTTCIGSNTGITGTYQKSSPTSANLTISWSISPRELSRQATTASVLVKRKWTPLTVLRRAYRRTDTLSDGGITELPGANRYWAAVCSMLELEVRTIFLPGLARKLGAPWHFWCEDCSLPRQLGNECTPQKLLPEKSSWFLCLGSLYLWWRRRQRSAPSGVSLS